MAFYLSFKLCGESKAHGGCFSASWHIQVPPFFLHLMLWSHRDCPLKSFLLSMKNQWIRRGKCTDRSAPSDVPSSLFLGTESTRITRRNTHPLNCVTQMSSSLPLWLNRQKGENKINTTCLAKPRSRTQRSTLGNFLHCGEITHLRRSVFALARPVVSLLAWSRRAAAATGVSQSDPLG